MKTVNCDKCGEQVEVNGYGTPDYYRVIIAHYQLNLECDHKMKKFDLCHGCHGEIKALLAPLLIKKPGVVDLAAPEKERSNE